MVQGFEDDQQILNIVRNEFAWFIALNEINDFQILLNDEPIDFKTAQLNEFTVETTDWDLKQQYVIRLILWKKSLGDEFSRFYFIDSMGKEAYKKTTTFNKKSDEYYHSVYIQSSYFNDFIFDPLEVSGQTGTFPTRSDEEFKLLMANINDELAQRRKAFLNDKKDKYIEAAITRKTYPRFDDSPFGRYRRDSLDSIVGALYTTEPRLLNDLTPEHQKVFFRMLDMIMSNGDVDNFFSILREVVEMSDEERRELAGVLKFTSLSHAAQTIKLIQDRVRVIQVMKELVFDKSFNTYEKHVQEMIENHFWIFGEQYHLLTAAEPDFEEALRQLIMAETGKADRVKIDHPDKQKEMDVYMIRQDKDGRATENVVVELKRPTVLLGENELSQVKRYMRVILEDERFNSATSKWTLYLVGTRFNTSGFIEGELKNLQHLGEPNLVYSVDNRIKIYVLTWSEIFAQFTLKYDHLLKRLKLSEELWKRKHDNVDEAVADGKDNSAAAQAS